MVAVPCLPLDIGVVKRTRPRTTTSIGGRCGGLRNLLLSTLTRTQLADMEQKRCRLQVMPYSKVRGKLSRAVVILLICISVAVTALVRKDGAAQPSRRLPASIVSGKGCVYAGVGYFFPKSRVLHNYDWIFLGVDAAVPLGQTQSPHTPTAQSEQLRKAFEQWWRDDSRKEMRRGEYRYVPAEEPFERAPGDPMLTRAAVEIALSLLEANPNNVAQAVSVGRPCCMKRAFEQSFFTYARTAVERVRSGNVSTAAGKSEIGSQRPDEKTLRQGRVYVEDVLAWLLPHIRQRHWFYDTGKKQAPDAVFDRQAALITVLEGTDYLKDTAEATGAQFQPEAGEKRFLGLVPNTAALLAALAGLLGAFQRFCVNAPETPSKVGASFLGRRPSTAQRRHVSPKNKTAAEERVLESDEQIENDLAVNHQQQNGTHSGKDKTGVRAGNSETEFRNKQEDKFLKHVPRRVGKIRHSRRSAYGTALDESSKEEAVEEHLTNPLGPPAIVTPQEKEYVLQTTLPGLQWAPAAAPPSYEAYNKTGG